jgi:hypothetical protein
MSRAVLILGLVCALGPDEWTPSLEGLDPVDPMAYFELAEEIADASDDRSQRELARHLFALAGVLDPPKLGRSACLALADLEPDEYAKRRLQALAALLDERAGGLGLGPPGETTYDHAAALAVTEAISPYRKGNGAKALASLRTPGAMEILDAYPVVFHGGAERFVEDCRQYRGSRPPSISAKDLVLMLQFEAALLAGEHRSWSGELLLTGGRPLIEVDPDRLESSFGVNGSKPCYREGEWQGCP